ncbi:TNF receptor-associated factor 4-like isoform X2 [Dysidea avara]|uniref:TNF receptor-associated factor 4-like isoform X2 n=1 Tax=Dysidea avara TaxID=196820 RepID=UPI00332C4336
MAATTPIDIGGYDYTFVNTPPDRLVCKICNYASHDPHMSLCCGHNFCESCLENANKATGITKACPLCRDDGFTTFRNKQADREVRSLQIVCPNEEIGCTWQGCEYEKVKCTNIDCKMMVQRRFLRDHVWMDCPHRKSFCHYCSTYDKYLFIIGDHMEQCPKYPLPCPNNCMVESVLREDMETHKKECPLEVIQCEYHNMGCEEGVMRMNKRKHDEEHIEEHLSMIKAKLSKTEDRLSGLEKMVNTFISKGAGPTARDRMITSGHSSIHLATMSTLICPVIVKMSRYSHYKSSGTEWRSDPFYSHNKGYKLVLLIDAAGCYDGRGTHLSVFLFLMKGQYDDELSWPLEGKFEIKLLNQISNHEHHIHTVIYDHTVSMLNSIRTYDDDDDDDDDFICMIPSLYGNGRAQFISNTDLHKVTPTCQYLKDECIFLQFLQLMTMATTGDIGGYEYTFIDTPTDHLVCNICHYPSQEPYMTVCCGHNFCKSCLDNIRKTTCPICQSKNFRAFPTSRLIGRLKILA